MGPADLDLTHETVLPVLHLHVLGLQYLKDQDACAVQSKSIKANCVIYEANSPGLSCSEVKAARRTSTLQSFNLSAIAEITF